MLHKLFDFTQTILGAVALVGIVAFSVITVSALNPSVKMVSSEEPMVAGISNDENPSNSLPVQFNNIIETSEGVRGNLSYISDSKSSYKIQLDNIIGTKTFTFLKADNVNNYPINFNLAIFLPESIKSDVKVEILDNIDTVSLSEQQKTLNLPSASSKELKIRFITSKNINFPVEVEVLITQ
ncbi:MAG: hypothetical protein ABI721_04985 [Candidatus Dojkabacteria bacterium]